MNFNAKDDFVIEQEIREEQEQLTEERQATEEDNGYDVRNIPDMTPDEEDAFENERQGGKSIFDDEPEEETDCE
jgi:hypothetical protein